MTERTCRGGAGEGTSTTTTATLTKCCCTLQRLSRGAQLEAVLTSARFQTRRTWSTGGCGYGPITATTALVACGSAPTPSLRRMPPVTRFDGRSGSVQGTIQTRRAKEGPTHRDASRTTGERPTPPLRRGAFTSRSSARCRQRLGLAGCRHRSLSTLPKS